MAQHVRFGDFVREVTVQQHRISYNELIPKPVVRPDGTELPHRPPPVKLTGMEAYRLLAPYASVRFRDQLKAVVPLALYLVFFQLIVLREAVQDSWVISAGLLAVIVGLMLFMEGLRLGLMPFGEAIGNTLPKKSPLWLVMLLAFILGVGVTFAEPAIGALKTAGSIVSVEEAPYLYALLNNWSGALVLAVGAGVGLAAVLGTLRFLYGWSLKPIIYASLVPGVALTLYCMTNPALEQVLGLAWDCGAVTTGPVTVPLVLALGIGVASAAGKGSSTLSGFGIVTLASIFPIIAVIVLALVVAARVTPEEIVAAAKVAAAAAQAETQWYDGTPWMDIILGLRATVPLILFLLFVLKVVLRERVHEAGIVLYGCVLTAVGMVIFNIGLTYGLVELGGQSGGLVPAAFMRIDEVASSPLYMAVVGIGIAVLFAWILGFGATLAEPALNALGMTVQQLTNGAFKKSMLMYAVSFGVAFGIAMGVVKIVYNIPLTWILLPSYCLGVVLTACSDEEFVNVAWDSAGVTTGPVTVPLVLAMGLGLGDAVGAIEGFGILSMASICPILSVLVMGLYVKWRERRVRQQVPAAAPGRYEEVRL